MFEKNLHDLVRGIRTNKNNEAKFIAACVEEIRNEIKTDNMTLKCQGITKLVYLQMLGYEMSWSNFNTIEVMSATKYTYKRVGYLAASQSFHENTDLLMLATNMIRKDLCSINQYESSLALTGLSCFVNPELARDLSGDLMTLISSSRPFIRKKAILAMYKVLLKFPDALRPAFPRIKEKLDDPDPGVQCAAVNVICELARKNPKNYISLAPVLFRMLTNSSNNWMLIKVIKLFGALMPEEPRLCKKLVDPLTNIIHSTNAMSLLYESINTLITGVPDHIPSIQLATQKLNIMLDDSDQNLKYLGLLALAKILKHHPKYVSPLKEKIIKCLDDKDESIRRRALDLVVGMVSRKNLPDIVKKLVEHVDSSENTTFKEELLLKIISICSQGNYQYVVNFEWYITVLVELTKLENTQHGRELANQMLDVTIRVKALRNFSVRQMSILIENMDKFAKGEKNGICEVIYAAGWIVGEFSDFIADKHKVLCDLFSPKVLLLPPHIQAILVQTAMKLYGALLLEQEAADIDSKELGEMFLSKISMFTDSNDLEVQERSCCALQLVKCLVKLQAKGAGVAEELQDLFREDLNPVAPKAQRKVPVPEGLDLDAWIYPPKHSKYSDDEGEGAGGPVQFGGGSSLPQANTFSSNMQGFGSESAAYPVSSASAQRYQEPSAEEVIHAREQRETQMKSNPYYLQGSLPVNKTSTYSKPEPSLNVNDIPVSSLTLDFPLKIEGSTRKGKKKKKKGKKGKKGRVVSEEEEEEVLPPMVDVMVSEMPDGAQDSEEEEVKLDPSDPHAALNIDLSGPFNKADNDIIQGPVPYSQSNVPAPGLNLMGTERRKGKKKKKRKVNGEPKKSQELEKRKTLKDIVAEAEQKTQIAVHKVPELEEAAPVQSIADWLNERRPGEEAPPPGEKTKKKKMKAKEEKGTKTKKKKKRSEDKENESNNLIPDILSLEENGVSSNATPVGVILSEDECLSLRYHPHTPSHSTLAFSLDFSNISTSEISNIKLDISDSINTKLIRSSPGALSVPFSLQPGQSNSHTVSLSLQAIYISQKLKGSVTYFLDSTQGGSGKEEKMINFALPLNLTLFLVPAPCEAAQFASLLAENSLASSSSVTLPATLEDGLEILTGRYKLGVVERVGGAVSLYGKTSRDHELAVLLKFSGSCSVSIKGNDEQLVNCFADLVSSARV